MSGTCAHGPASRFKRYTEVVRDKLMPKYNAAVHWAKLEAPPAGTSEARQARAHLATRYPVDKVRRA